MTNKFTIDIEFDKPAWDSLSDDERSEWLNTVIDMLNSEVYVSGFGNVQTITPDTTMGELFDM